MLRSCVGRPGLDVLGFGFDGDGLLLGRSRRRVSQGKAASWQGTKSVQENVIFLSACPAQIADEVAQGVFKAACADEWGYVHI